MDGVAVAILISDGFEFNEVILGERLFGYPVFNWIGLGSYQGGDKCSKVCVRVFTFKVCGVYPPCEGDIGHWTGEILFSFEGGVFDYFIGRDLGRDFEGLRRFKGGGK